MLFSKSLARARLFCFRGEVSGRKEQMSTPKKNAKRAPARSKEGRCPTCRRSYRDGAALLEKLLMKAEEKLADAELKPTIADFLRLLQFQEEIEADEQPKEIKVTWVDPAEKSEEG